MPDTLSRDLFRMSRTFKTFNKVQKDLEHLLELGDKDRHAAVQAALHSLAASLLDNIGKQESAAQLREQYKQLLPLALKAVSPLVKRAKGQARLAALTETGEAPATTPTAEPTKRKPGRPPKVKEPTAEKKPLVFRGRPPKAVKQYLRAKARGKPGRPSKEVSEWMHAHVA